MGLFKRGATWWMRFSYKGRQIRQSTETDDKKLAERIYHKVLGAIAEGRWFERLPGKDKTFGEMMEKYVTEHASKKLSEKSFRGHARILTSSLGGYTLTEVTPRVVNEYKEKRRRDGLKPASINRELATMKKAFHLAVKEWEWLKDNPVARVSMEEENNKRDRRVTAEEEGRVLEGCPPLAQGIGDIRFEYGYETRRNPFS